MYVCLFFACQFVFCVLCVGCFQSSLFSWRRYVKPLYQHIIHADYDTLCFLGIPLAVPSPLPLFEAQAYFAASHLRKAFTSRKQRQEWVQQACANAARSQDWACEKDHGQTFFGGALFRHVSGCFAATLSDRWFVFMFLSRLVGGNFCWHNMPFCQNTNGPHLCKTV